MPKDRLTNVPSEVHYGPTDLLLSCIEA